MCLFFVFCLASLWDLDVPALFAFTFLTSLVCREHQLGPRGKLSPFISLAPSGPLLLLIGNFKVKFKGTENK